MVATTEQIFSGGLVAEGGTTQKEQRQEPQREQKQEEEMATGEE